MSVPVFNRKESNLNAVLKSLETVKVIYSMLIDDKIFPRKARWVLSKPISEVTGDFLKEISYAQTIEVSNSETYKTKLNSISRAKSLLKSLEPLLMVSKMILDYNVDKVESLAEKLIETEEEIKKWMKLENSRYEKLMKQR